MEDRITPSNWLVTDASGGAGSTGDVTLPYAVANAQNGDSITFNLPSPSTITVSATLMLNQSITINGPGAANLAVDGGGSVQVFNIAAGADVSIWGLTIQNGAAQSGAGIDNAGTLTLVSDAISNNGSTANNTNVFGAGIYNSGTLTASDCTINNNTANSDGGGLCNTGIAMLSDTTVFDNAASVYGGGIYSAGTLFLSDSTVAGNAGLPLAGGGIFNSAGDSLQMDNSIVAGNGSPETAGPDIYGPITANYSLIGNASGNTIINGSNNLVGVNAGLATSLAYNNNAPTQTLALLSGSIAIAAGDPGQAGTLAQNEIVRPADPAIGAYQSGPTVITNTADLPDNATALVIYGSNFDPNAANDTVAFSLGVVGTVTSATSTMLEVQLTSPPTALGPLHAVVTVNGISSPAVQVANEVNSSWLVTDPSGAADSGSLTDITLPYAVAHALSGDPISFSFPAAATIGLAAPLMLDQSVTIAGPGAANLVITGGGAVQVFNIAAGANVSISGLTIVNGYAGSGGGIFNAGTLNLSDATVSNNMANVGCGIENQGTLTLSNDAITGNWSVAGVPGSDIDNASGATLSAGDANAFASSTNVSNNGTIDLGGNSNSIGALIGASTACILSNGGAATLNVAGGGFFAGKIQDGSGTVALTVAGSNTTLTLTGVNSYSGPTTINGGDTLQAGSKTAFSAKSQFIDSGTLDLAGYDTSIAALSGSGIVTSNLVTTPYQIDNNNFQFGFNDSLYATEPADNWVGNVFTSSVGGTLLQSVSFLDSQQPLNASNLPNPYVTAALYTGAPGAGLTIVPGSVYTMALNANPGWITVPFASLQNIPAGAVFTAAVLIDDVPGNVFPFTIDTSNNSTGSYFDVNSPYDLGGTYVNTYDIASPNLPTPNGDPWNGPGGGGSNTSFPGATFLRVNLVAQAATLTVTGGGSFNGNIQDGNNGNTVALTVAGANQVLTLSGNNTYSGLTTIDSGATLQAGSSTALTANTSVTNDGTLDLHYNDITIFALNGDSGGAVINSGSASGATLTVTGGGSFAGNISGANTALTLEPSTLILLGNNSYAGTTIINFGDTLIAGSTTAFSATSDVTDNGTLDLGGFGNTIGALNGNGVVTSSAGDGTLTVSRGGFFSGTLQDDGAIALTVAGTGQTLTLSAANTYTGQTVITNSNTLLVDGSETSPVTDNGTLGGTGAVGNVTVASGIVDPGDPVGSTGTLSASSADFSNAGSLNVEITGGSPTSDLLSVTGGVTMGGASTLNIDLTGLNSTGTFTIVSDGGQTGQFTTVNVLNNVNGYVVTVGYTNDTVFVTVAPPPPPPPIITDVVINQDLSALYNAPGQPMPGAQRSMVNDVVYTFSEAVNILSPGTDPNVFTVAVAAGWTGTAPTLSWVAVAGSGHTQWAVSFTGGSVTGGSITNGAYTITVNDPASITAVSDSQALTVTPGLAPSSGDFGYATQSLFRLFGDINGDEFVNAVDNLKLKNALMIYNPAFDYNSDGTVNAFDNVKFKNDFPVNFSGFTPTI